MCLCLSALPVFLQTNVLALAAVDVAGLAKVDAIIRALVCAGWLQIMHAAFESLTLPSQINERAPSSKCNYPDHSKPACIDGDPCRFTCEDGFMPFPMQHPTKCVCSAPSIVCNGQCVAAGACPSSAAIVKKRSWVGSGACSEMGPGWVACGVLGGGPRSWECIDAARDLESCKCLFSRPALFRQLRNLSGAKVVVAYTP